MTDPHHAVISRLSADFAAISHQLARVSTDLTELDRVLSQRPGDFATHAIRSARGAVHPASGAVLAVAAGSACGAASCAFGTAPAQG